MKQEMTGQIISIVLDKGP